MDGEFIIYLAQCPNVDGSRFYSLQIAIFGCIVSVNFFVVTAAMAFVSLRPLNIFGLMCFEAIRDHKRSTLFTKCHFLTQIKSNDANNKTTHQQQQQLHSHTEWISLSDFNIGDCDSVYSQRITKRSQTFCFFFSSGLCSFIWHLKNAHTTSISILLMDGECRVFAVCGWIGQITESAGNSLSSTSICFFAIVFLVFCICINAYRQI